MQCLAQSGRPISDPAKRQSNLLIYIRGHLTPKIQFALLCLYIYYTTLLHWRRMQVVSDTIRLILIRIKYRLVW